MYKRILVAVDGSASSARALVTAIDLAAAFGSRLRLVHVIEGMAYSSRDGPAGDAGGLTDVLRDAGARLLRRSLEEARDRGVEADTMLFDKPDERLGETVATAAKLWGADLVVVGTHGRHGLARVLLGSGAEQIVRLAPVPVMVVRSTEPG